MVKSNRYAPTNKKFKSHFENFASEKVKKGHLNSKNDRDSEDTSIKKGVLVRIERKKMYDNGWEVKIDGKKVNCSFNGNIVAIPECTVTDAYFIPKKTCNVEVQLDTVSKIYSIIKIKDVNLTPIALYDNQITISPNTNTDTNQNNEASIKISRTSVNITGSVMAGYLNANNINVDGDVKSANITTLESEVTGLKKQIKELQEGANEVAELKEQIKELQGDTNNAG